MDIAARLMVPVFVGMVGLVGALPGTPDEGEAHRRLEAMPRERRLALAGNLERFDKLGPAEQAAIRRLDAELAKEDPVDRGRYRDVLRRYHLWFNGLTDAQKRKLQEAESDDARFNLATQFRRDEMARKPYPGPRISGIRTGDLGLIGPFEAAHLLRIWQKLPDHIKADLSKRPGARLRRDLDAQGKTYGVDPERLSPLDEARYDEVLNKDSEFKGLLGPWAYRVATKKAAELSRNGEAGPKRFLSAYPAFLYFEEHAPIPVRPENLAKFAASCPPWLMATLDPLSPDDARHYLTTLYRLVYPIPNEIESPSDKAKGDSKPPSPAKVGPKPPAKKTQGPIP